MSNLFLNYVSSFKFSIYIFLKSDLLFGKAVFDYAP